MPAAIFAKQVRYIKLGTGGAWEEECLENGTIRLGFDTERPSRFRICQSGNWNKLNKTLAKQFTNQVRSFFEDDGTTLWITFHADRMYWGFLAPNPTELHASGSGTYRIIAGGWQCEDLKGQVLSKNRVSKAWTMYAKHKGTSCNVKIASYILRRINGKTSARLEQGLLEASQPNLFPNEVEVNETFPEGAVCRVTVNAYERNQKARQRCIERHGTTCCICEFNFGQTYGPVADGFIHVHHLRELSQVGAGYAVDPEKDLRPVCPNCHAVLHRSKPTQSIEEVKSLLQKYK